MPSYLVAFSRCLGGALTAAARVGMDEIARYAIATRLREPVLSLEARG